MKLLPCIFLIFLTLKLAGIGVVATWSWWLVTMPLWIGFAALVVAIVAGLFILGAGGTWTAICDGLKRK
ncbi:transmembrane Fragile-X-F family protein [Burkholderia thailandensis MSMB121]|uniref:Fragile-X-F family protein n=1 Tax=Burkholderia humptydooensis TaxID=430531 RepID=UPI000327F9E9|nr:Fragile-X-F family protein [Burkholderia humptydooensis]AGK46997.1 transmembrane Fragile-X-F family protein [Burkholderia thailandensis MSMB121]ATF36660.1 transmembrane Fragile-X-F family protein [Burkholderia thailandensis]KST74038.1 transmembrane Fragile-X-F family protein [Burkholderia humptydooensis]